MKRIPWKYQAQYWLLRGLLAIFHILPLRQASGLGSLLGRVALHFLHRGHRVAEENLTRVFPSLSSKERQQLVQEMSRNLGCLCGEFPHIARMHVTDMKGKGDIRVEGGDTLHRLRATHRPVIFISAHCGNWEVFARVAAAYGLPITRIYRTANNPLAERLIQRERAKVPGGFLPKGAAGARDAMRALKEGRSLAFLMDQRTSDGMEVPFFGLPAMTATGPVELALRFNCPLVLARCIRRKGYLQVVIEPPLDIPVTSDRAGLVRELTATINSRFESWIREHPAQWLWLHRRWR